MDHMQMDSMKRSDVGKMFYHSKIVLQLPGSIFLMVNSQSSSFLTYQ